MMCLLGGDDEVLLNYRSGDCPQYCFWHNRVCVCMFVFVFVYFSCCQHLAYIRSLCIFSQADAVFYIKSYPHPISNYWD